MSSQHLDFAVVLKATLSCDENVNDPLGWSGQGPDVYSLALARISVLSALP